MTEAPPRPRMLRPVGVGVVVLTGIIGVFIVIRAITDWPYIVAGTLPDDDFAKRYVAHPWLGYLHIGLGIVYLLGAPLQLSRRFRTRHYDVHRRLGRVLLTCGLLSGALVLIFGVLFPWGGAIEGTAAVVFGVWFVACLVFAFGAIRRHDVPAHRRWMIRAFAVSLGVGTIRIWVGIFIVIVLATTNQSDPVLPEPVTFAVAFWLGLAMHVAIGEWWLRRTPPLDG